MSATSKKSPKKTNSNNAKPTGAVAKDLEMEAEVLFQRIYDKWYAFSVVDEECLMTEVTDEEVTKRLVRKIPRAS